MLSILNSIDNINDIKTDKQPILWLERFTFIFLFIMVLFAPHSILVTQGAWLLGMIFWAVRYFIKPRPKFFRTPLDTALWAFFIWTVITSIFSFAPDISLGKLRGAGIFLLFYFVVNNIRRLRAAKLLAFTLIFSCMVSAGWSPIERIFGYGIEISAVKPESIFTKAVYFNHDKYLKAISSKRTLPDDLRVEIEKVERADPLGTDDAVVKANGKIIGTPEELIAEVEKNDLTFLECFRSPNYFTVIVKRDDLFNDENSLEKLGIGNWYRSRSWRYAGFYGHIITYAEVLQLIASLVFGLFIASFSRNTFVEKTSNERQKWKLILLFCFMTMLVALALTFTRSAQIALFASVILIIIANDNRQLIWNILVFIFPIALLGIFFIEQNRQVGMLDDSDRSSVYRQTLYREGFDLWSQSPRNMVLGVGMDSTKRFAADWQLFDNGNLPAGHFHSTPIQLLVERGIPAYFLWLLILGIYARTLWRGLRFSHSELGDESFNSRDWQKRGILLGGLGGLGGFLVSSLFNYSFGDSEVVMVFYLIMGLSVYCSVQHRKK